MIIWKNLPDCADVGKHNLCYMSQGYVKWQRKFVLSNFIHACSNLNVILSLRHVSMLLVDLLPDAAVESLVPLPGLLIHTVMEALQHFKLSIICLYLAQHTQTHRHYS